MPDPSLFERLATPGDAVAIERLVGRAYRDEESAPGWLSEAELVDGARIDVDGVIELIDPPRSQILLMEDAAGVPIACCNVREHEPGAAYFGLLSVLPSHQDRGVGRTLLARAEAGAVEWWRAREMRMRVLEPRELLIAWYERRGYRRTGERTLFTEIVPGVTTKVEDLHFVVLVKPLPGDAD